VVFDHENTVILLLELMVSSVLHCSDENIGLCDFQF